MFYALDAPKPEASAREGWVFLGTLLWWWWWWKWNLLSSVDE
jgi:hypothetical protein